MELLVRYQSPVPDRRGRRIGIFGLVNMLANRGYLSAEEERFRRTANAWYDATYANPSTVDPSVYEDEHQVVVVPHEDLDFTSMMWLRPKLP